MAIALLAARLVLGLGLFAHGAQKLFGWFGGYGVKGTGGFMESMGFRPGALFAIGAGLGEAGGGLLTALGLGGPIGPALIVMVMIVAIFSVHISKGFFNGNGGYEFPLTNIAFALALSFAGFGPLSFDAAFGISDVWSDAARWIVLFAGLLIGFVNLAVRRPSAKTQATA